MAFAPPQSNGFPPQPFAAGAPMGMKQPQGIANFYDDASRSQHNGSPFAGAPNNAANGPPPPQPQYSPSPVQGGQAANSRSPVPAGHDQGYRQSPVPGQGAFSPPQPGPEQVGPADFSRPGASPQFNQPPAPGQYNQPPAPGQFNQPPGPGAPGQFNQPPNVGAPGQFNQPQSHGGPGQFNQPSAASAPGQFNQSPVPGQFNQPPPPGQFNQPPPPGQFNQPPPPGQFNQPPAPGQFNQPPAPGQFTQPPAPGQFNQPPAPGQPGQFQRPPGQPPQPGYPQQPGYNQAQQPQPQQQFGQGQFAPQKRLNADDMPGPIAVIGEDVSRWSSGVFPTGGQGVVPPLVTTEVIVEDQGNSNPRFMRAITCTLPITAEMSKASHLPMGLAVTPMAPLHPQERPLQVVDMGPGGPVRCRRCKAYMSPLMQFVEGGRRFTCRLCEAVTETPTEYFCHLDYTGQRQDRLQRAELFFGSYELLATEDYCRDQKLPKAPAYIFMIDVSATAVYSGLLHILAANFKRVVLENLAKEPGKEDTDIRIGIATYHTVIHFYNLSPGLSQPQMMVVADLEEMFVPMADGFLVSWREAEPLIDCLLEQLPGMFATSQQPETMLGPVIEAGMDALKQSERCGKLFIFHSALPSKTAPGVLKNRDDRKVIGTDKEKTLFSPGGTYYSKLGEACVAAGCSVELFLFANQYADLASMAEVPRITGGDLHKYTHFNADTQGARLLADLANVVSREVAFDAVLRLRTSTGIRPVDFYGNFLMSNSTDVELASVDAQKTVTIELKHDDKLSEETGACAQAALLYTSISGQRRLRIHNLQLKVSSKFLDVFRSSELDTFINLIAKKSINVLLNESAKSLREKVTKQASHVLACYRKNCATPSTAGQLVLPECMKLLPLYVNCLTKHETFHSGAELSTDDRTYYLFRLASMSPAESQAFFYPRLLPLLPPPSDEGLLPNSIRCSIERLSDAGAYLLETGEQLFFWIGLNCPADFIQDVFAVQSSAMISSTLCDLPQLDNVSSQRVRAVLQRVREQRANFMKITVVVQHRQADALEFMFRRYMVEDQTVGVSYVDFLCHVHKEIRDLLD